MQHRDAEEPSVTIGRLPAAMARGSPGRLSAAGIPSGPIPRDARRETAPDMISPWPAPASACRAVPRNAPDPSPAE